MCDGGHAVPVVAEDAVATVGFEWGCVDEETEECQDLSVGRSPDGAHQSIRNIHMGVYVIIYIYTNIIYIYIHIYT